MACSIKNVDIYIICPAIVMYEGKEAPFYPFGRCTFLTVDQWKKIVNN